MPEIILSISVICILVLIFIFVRSHYERKQFRIVCYTVADEGLPSEFAGKKIVFLSDLHGHIYGDNNDVLLHAVDEQTPDLICIGGDMMVVKDWSRQDFHVIFHLLDELCKKYPVVYADGNHEQRMREFGDRYPGWYESFCIELKKRKVVYLQNTTCFLTISRDGQSHLEISDKFLPERGATILLSGLSLEMKYFAKLFFVRRLQLPEKYLQSKIPEISGKEYHILLAHTPQFVDNYVKSGANLILSGHFHGGCLRLPKIGAVCSPQLQLFPRYAAGYKRKGNAHVIVSAGLGTHSVNIRVNNPPELVVITLDKEHGA